MEILPIYVAAFISLQLFSHSAIAQIDIGIKGGLSIPNLTSGKSSNPINTGYKSRLGLDFSIQLEYYLSKNLSIQPQLEYSEQGGKKNGNQAFAVPVSMQAQFPVGAIPSYLYADYKSVAKINYLILPILVKYHIGIGKFFGAYLGLGPCISILIKANNITTGSSNIYLDALHTQPITSSAQSFDQTENIKDQLHTLNAGFSGLIGINYNLPRGSIFLEGGGNYGLIDIQKDGANGKNKTGAGTVSIGYLFHIKN